MRYTWLVLGLSPVVSISKKRRFKREKFSEKNSKFNSVDSEQRIFLFVIILTNSFLIVFKIVPKITKNS